MATAAQITANQANAQRSTGPRTPEGKARAARNAVRHGLTARHLVVRDDEREDLAQLQAELTAELDPSGPTETIVFEELLHAAWNLRRFRRIEAELSTGSATDFAPDGVNTAALDRLTRYQARAQRSYYRAVAELRTLQTNRALRGVKLVPEADAEIPAITDINDLTKQTRSEVIAEGIKLAMKITEFEATNYARERRLAGHDTAGPNPHDASAKLCAHLAAFPDSARLDLAAL
jgi:hypothetical protein